MKYAVNHSSYSQINTKTMKKAGLFVAAIAALMLSSCAVVSTGTGTGFLYTSVDEGMAVTSNSIGTKVGESKATNILGLVATGDATINTAAKNAGIREISHVDVKKTTILGIFATYTTVVYGN